MTSGPRDCPFCGIILAALISGCMWVAIWHVVGALM